MKSRTEINRRLADRGGTDFFMCGHNQKRVRGWALHGITSLEIRVNCERFRGIIYDTDARQIRWSCEWLPAA